MSCYTRENLLVLLKEIGVKWDYKDEKEALDNMDGWNGDGDQYYMISEVLVPEGTLVGWKELLK